MHKRGIIRYANYTVCASVFIHFCMQRKNNENIPIVTQCTVPVKFPESISDNHVSVIFVRAVMQE